LSTPLARTSAPRRAPRPIATSDLPTSDPSTAAFHIGAKFGKVPLILWMARSLFGLTATPVPLLNDVSIE
jgi:hypothetical protein